MGDIDKSVWSRWEIVLIVFVVIACLVIAGGYASYALIFAPHVPASSELTVENGDSISVQYIGMFEDGTVFDTSIRSVAENNTLYPKSLSFEPKTSYEPLSFTVGTGQMISGFDKGVVGMSLNQTKIITLPPEQAYGLPDETMIEERNLVESTKVFEWYGNTSTFVENFNVYPEVGTNVKNQVYGWNMTVFHVDVLGDKVMIKNNPLPGEIIQSIYGWTSKVVSIDSSVNNGSGEILVRHLISTEDIGTRLFNDDFGNPFKITAINSNAGTFTIDYNREVVGKTLIFKVTIVSITRT